MFCNIKLPPLHEGYRSPWKRYWKIKQWNIVPYHCRSGFTWIQSSLIYVPQMSARNSWTTSQCMLKRKQTLLSQQLWNCLYKKWNSMGTSSTFLHELLETIQENIITLLAKRKTGQAVKNMLVLSYVSTSWTKNHCMFQTQQKFWTCFFKK